jgi:hypothetical protein
MSVQSGSIASFPTTLSPYSKFRMALKSKEVQRQYPSLLEKFLDFYKFEGLNVVLKSQEFFRFTKNKSQLYLIRKIKGLFNAMNIENLSGPGEYHFAYIASLLSFASRTILEITIPKSLQENISRVVNEYKILTCI